VCGWRRPYAADCAEYVPKTVRGSSRDSRSLIEQRLCDNAHNFTPVQSTYPATKEGRGAFFVGYEERCSPSGWCPHWSAVVLPGAGLVLSSFFVPWVRR
jgi:hypothetical protein